MGWITSLWGWRRGQRQGLTSRGYAALNTDTLPRSGFVQQELIAIGFSDDFRLANCA
jgi:hypothetical protein